MTQVQAYSPIAKGLHWLIVLLVIIQFLIAVSMPEIGPEVVPGTLINLHFSFGLVIVAVMGIRFIYRLSHPVLLEASEVPHWERWTARATHRIFYFILLLGPFLGWASASAHKLDVSIFGIIPLPAIAASRARWALTAGDIHSYLMWGLLGLVALHAAAALYHHFSRHDGVLQRMLPARHK